MECFRTEFSVSDSGLNNRMQHRAGTNLFLHSFALLDLGGLTADVSLLSSLAVIIGAIFVAVQLTQNNRLIRTAAEQAKAAAIQAKLTTEQMKQNNDLANMDLIMRLYEFANTAEVQSA